MQREATSADEHERGLDTSGVDDALRSGGRPLEESVRRPMEARFGHDFGAVRLHDDAAAARAAAGLHARAFTTGEHVVLDGRGGDARTPQGRHLLAHELAHVVQQRSSAGGGVDRVQRRGAGEWLGILLGLEEGTWSDRELHAYLDALTARDAIDGSYDADNRARAVVRRWKAAAPGFDLLGRQKSLLVEEMLDGPTLDDDEACILDLLEGSDAADLREIFAQARTRLEALDSDLHGAEHDRLTAFLESRFRGGRAALRAGTVDVVGAVVPPGAPAYGFDAATLEARLDAGRSVAEMAALLDRWPAAERAKALDHLLREVWPRSKSELGRARHAMMEEGVTDDQKSAIYEGTAGTRRRVATLEKLLMHYFAAGVPASKEALLAGTSPADPARAEALTEALRPHQYAAEAEAEDDLIELDEIEAPGLEQHQGATEAGKKDPAGSAKPKPRSAFHDPEKYRAEVAQELPGIIDAAYARHVTDAGPRAPMSEIEAMAGPAKQETDHVFGAFYDTSRKAQLTGDRPGKRGSLHFWYETADRELKAMSTPQRRRLAVRWLHYYFESDATIRLLNDKYSASPTFDAASRPVNAEAKILSSLADSMTAGKAGQEVVRKLVETRRSWGGMTRGHEVFVDLFHDPDADADREARWEMFQTLVHEYLHTLVHPAYERYAVSFGGTSEQWNTLIEGVDCVLDEVVWAHVQPKATDAALRTAVEGPAHAKLPPLAELPYPGRYPSTEDAIRLVGLVGIEAVYAAYFLGKVDRIRVSPAARKAATTGVKP